MRESVSEMMRACARARARTRSTHLRTIDADRSLVVRGALRCHDDQWQCHALIADSRSFARSAVRGLRSRVRRDATEKGEENTHAHTHARTQHVRMHARTHVARTHARTHAKRQASGIMRVRSGHAGLPRSLPGFSSFHVLQRRFRTSFKL